MTKQFKKDLKAKGYNNPKVVYHRYDTHSIGYEVYFDASDKRIAWENNYFVGEKDSANSKESMLEDWNKFVNAL